MKCFYSIFALALLSACASKVKYETAFVSVGPSMEKQKEIQAEGFHDKNVVIVASMTSQSIGLGIVNRTKKPIKVIWDDMLYIDSQKQTHKVFHSGVRYIAAKEHQPPSIILPGLKHVDNISRSDNIQFSTGQYGGWSGGNILPTSFRSQVNRQNNQMTSAEEEFKNYVETSQVLEKPHYLYIPLMVDGNVKEYYVAFKVKSATL